MTLDPVEPKEDEARDAGELLLQNGSARLTETSEETVDVQSEELKLDENQVPSEEERLRAEEEEEEEEEGANVTDDEPDSTEIDKNTLCGLGSYHPSWLQWFASKKTYVVVFGLIGMMDIAVGTYFISTISTLEKRFKIPSRTSGILSSAWDIGGLSSSLLLAYLGSRGHKTRWVAAGSFLAATTCFIRYLPHIMFGPGQDALELTLEYGGDLARNVSAKTSAETDKQNRYLLHFSPQGVSLADCSIEVWHRVSTPTPQIQMRLLDLKDTTPIEYLKNCSHEAAYIPDQFSQWRKISMSGAHNSSKAFLCHNEYENLEDCSISSTSTVPTIIFFVSYMLLGVGTSMYYTLGVAYMDDNVRKNKTPFLLAIWQCIRMLGPTFGFLFGSYVLRIYVEPSLHPTITVDDPRWIGAWWLGWIPLGVVLAILSFMLALFPKRLPRAARRSKLRREPPSTTTKSFADFKMVLKRLVRNKILLFNSFSSVCFMFGYIGYWVFMPKYMETQFRQSASTSSFITGSIGLVFSALGILAAGSVISLFKPRARYLAGWNVIVETLDAVGHFSYSFLNCAIDDLHGSPGSDKTWNLLASCNADCDCGPMVKYSPICSLDGNTTFYSPCHAGCTSIDFINGTKMFGNCSCIGDGSGWAKDGACPVDCSTTFTIFLIIQCTMRFFSASGRAGNTIIQFRCVDKDDKSMSIGFTEALLSSLAFIPGPIVYGMLLDSACMVWGQTCGKSGNCWLYDGERLGFLLNFTASAFLLGGTLLDIGVWYYVKDLKIYDDSNPEKEKKKSWFKTRRT